MGAIDLDPASSHEAQRLVKAGAYFTKDHSGLENEWSGRVWLNPPYKAGLVSKFVDKLIAEMQACRVTQAIMLTNNATETKWAQRLVESRMVHCIALLKGRVQFLHFDENDVLVPKLESAARASALGAVHQHRTFSINRERRKTRQKL